ncbi:MAG: BON domain-containing protein [Chloroflexota bacterium]
MAETKEKAPRSDAQIEAEVQRVLHSYPPLVHDRHRLTITVNDGMLKVSGYVKSVPTYHYLRENLTRIEGVREVDANELYDDENIRRDVGQVVPYGVQVIVEYGAVILAGQLNEDAAVEDLVRKVALVPGVHRVLTTFS